MVQRKTVMGGGGLPGNYQIVQSKILQNVKYILSREIRQEELQNKVVIVRFKLFCHYVVRF
jgi:hypothetical protein